MGINRILELIAGNQPLIPDQDQEQLISLGGPLSPPPAVPLPLIASEGIQGALDLISPQGAPEAPRRLDRAAFTTTPVPQTERTAISDFIDFEASAEELARRERVIDRTPQEFSEEVVKSFVSGQPSDDPNVRAATMLMEIAPGPGDVADVRDLIHGFSNADPFLAGIGAVGLIPVIGGAAKRALKTAGNLSDVPGLSRIERYLTSAERRQVKRKDVAATVVNAFDKLPEASVLASGALAGKVKRGWYRESAAAIRETFGADAPRFVGLLASLSPQVAVKTNLENSLRTWRNWTAAGRPRDEASIRTILGQSVQVADLNTVNLKNLKKKANAARKNFGVNITARTEEGLRRQLNERLTEDQLRQLSVLEAWAPNAVRALRAEDPLDVVLSGPKVDSFMKNLLDDSGAVTLDTWMAKIDRVDQRLFSGSLTGGAKATGRSTGQAPGKSGAYLAMSARIRETADELKRLTGDNWTPAEVQETIWSWSYALDETLGGGGAAAKRGELRQLISQVTDEDILGVPDFATLLNEAGNRAALEAAGLSAPALRAATAPASSTLRAAAEAVPGAGAEAATAAGRLGPQPRIEDLEELARNIERHAQGDLALRPVPKPRKKKTR